MLMIRLQRVGRRHDPHFRVVLTDKQNGPKSGRFLSILGSYNAKAGDIQLKGDTIKEWISKGAQVSDTVHNMLISKGIIDGKKINVLPQKSPVVKEETKESAKTSDEVLADKEEVKEQVPTPEEGTAEEAKTETTETHKEESKAELVETPKEEKSEVVEEKAESTETSGEVSVDKEKKEE